MKIRFWGVRGSIPTPGPSTVRYGGNTACIEVRSADGGLLVLDAGTGIRELGAELLRRAPAGGLAIDLLLSHLHWDHIQGIPFFRPAFDVRNRLRIWGPRQKTPIRQLLGVGMHDTFFPVDLEGMPAAFDFHDLAPDTEVAVGGFTVRTVALRHPAPTLGYRVAANGAALVYATDTEDAFADGENPIAAFAAGAHTLIHDAQYLPEDFKAGWGHSTVQAAIDVAARAGVRRLVLTHHDPDRSDEGLDRIADLSLGLARERGLDLEVVVAKEGLELEIP